MPKIEFLKRFFGKEAELVKDVFSPGVIEIESNDGINEALVVNPRLETMSREYQRHESIAGSIKVSRVDSHFICNNYVVQF
jgi:hypothetical protein